jgi:hypothetical protein
MELRLAPGAGAAAPPALSMRQPQPRRHRYSQAEPYGEMSYTLRLQERDTSHRSRDFFIAGLIVGTLVSLVGSELRAIAASARDCRRSRAGKAVAVRAGPSQPRRAAPPLRATQTRS